MKKLAVDPWPALLAISFAGAFLHVSPVVGAEVTERPTQLDSTLSLQPDALEFDLAKLRAHARVVYVSSGARSFAVRMIDNDARTAFRFSGSDLHPTVIVQLAENETLHRVSATFHAQAVRLDVYLTNELPKDADDIRLLKPVASIVDLKADEKAVADFAPQEARYVTLRWTLDQHSAGSFKVAEISVFGGMALSFVDPDVGLLPPADPVVSLPIIPVVSPD